jgi:hypothetical protein
MQTMRRFVFGTRFIRYALRSGKNDSLVVRKQEMYPCAGCGCTG